MATSGSSGGDKRLAKAAVEAIDEAIDGLRACRQHLNEIKTSQLLRAIHLKLGHVALALDLEMDGETAKADAALRLAEGRLGGSQGGIEPAPDPHGFPDWPKDDH